jgi:hypothetical protein
MLAFSGNIVITATAGRRPSKRDCCVLNGGHDQSRLRAIARWSEPARTLREEVLSGEQVERRPAAILAADVAAAFDRPLRDWLLGGARNTAETTALIEELGERLNAAGIEVRRITKGIPILHPQVASYSALWNRGTPVPSANFTWTRRL